MSNVEKLRDVLERPGMYLDEEDLGHAVTFVAGLSFGLETDPFAEFRAWLIKQFFTSKEDFAMRPFGWEYVIYKTPSCSTENERENVLSFLDLVRRYLDHVELEQKR